MGFMRRLTLVTILAVAALAGCSEPPPWEERAQPELRCPEGEFVVGADPDGGVSCAAPRAWAACGPGEVVTGFDGRGQPVCRGIMDVAMEGEREYAREYPPEPSPPPARTRSLSLSSSGALADGSKTYTIASATGGLHWAELTFTVDGARFAQDATTSCEVRVLATPSSFRACSAGALEEVSGLVDAGDQLTLYAVRPGQTMRAIDGDSNSVVLTLTIG